VEQPSLEVARFFGLIEEKEKNEGDGVGNE